MFTDETSYTDNPRNLESFFSKNGESRWRVGFGLAMAVFALSEDALSFGALGNLPGALTADLTMAPPVPIAAAPSVPSRNNGNSSNVPCSGDTLTNSAHQVDQDQVSAGSVGQMSLPLIGGARAFKINARRKFQD